MLQPWVLNKKSIKSVDDLIYVDKTIIGFVYKITNLKTGKFYIGKKELYHRRKTRISKLEKTRTATRKIFKQVIKESDWIKYKGSCKELLEDIKLLGEEFFSREILETCFSKKHLSYCEVKHQFFNDVLGKNAYNGNILGKFFPSDLTNVKENE